MDAKYIKKLISALREDLTLLSVYTSGDGADWADATQDDYVSISSLTNDIAFNKFCDAKYYQLGDVINWYYNQVDKINRKKHTKPDKRLIKMFHLHDNKKMRKDILAEEKEMDKEIVDYNCYTQAVGIVKNSIYELETKAGIAYLNNTKVSMPTRQKLIKLSYQKNLSPNKLINLALTKYLDK